MLTKQQLLIPRVLCIGGKDSKQGDRLWPESRLKVGDILTLNYGIFWCDEFESGYVDGFYLYFPHLFKPLPWWYGRAVEELPEYLNIDGGVFKVDMYDFGNDVVYVFTITVVPVLLRQCTPADESEYQEYQKQKEA